VDAPITSRILRDRRIAASSSTRETTEPSSLANLCFVPGDGEIRGVPCSLAEGGESTLLWSDLLPLTVGDNPEWPDRRASYLSSIGPGYCAGLLDYGGCSSHRIARDRAEIAGPELAGPQHASDSRRVRMEAWRTDGIDVADQHPDTEFERRRGVCRRNIAPPRSNQYPLKFQGTSGCVF